MDFTKLIFAVLQYGPALFSDAETVFKDVTSGEGGVQKVQNVIDALGHLLGHAAGAASAVKPQ